MKINEKDIREHALNYCNNMNRKEGKYHYASSTCIYTHCLIKEQYCLDYIRKILERKRLVSKKTLDVLYIVLSESYLEAGIFSEAVRYAKKSGNKSLVDRIIQKSERDRKEESEIEDDRWSWKN